MNKVYGLKTEFTYFREDGGRYVICYGMESVDNDYATWYEVYYYKKQHPNISYKDVKDAIIGDINAKTDEKILSGFVWNGINVWLSAENQRNFSEAQRMAEKYGEAVLPLTFKLGEAEDETPVYHTFETVAELDDFYVKAFSYVNRCLQEGWAEKDSIDWTPYEELFPVPENNVE